MDQDETRHAGRPQLWPHCVRWGPSSPSLKGAQPPIFGPYLLWPMAGWIKMPLGRQVDPRNIVSNGEWDPAPPPQKGTRAPNFRPNAHVYCGQTAGWIKMSLGMEVVLGPGHIVLDWDPTPPPTKKGTAPNFRPMHVVVKRLDGLRCHLVRR